MNTFKVLGLLMSYPKPEWVAHLDECEMLLQQEDFLPKKHFQAVQVGHVPVGHDELEAAVTQLFQADGAVFGLIHVLETQLFEQVADDPPHGGEVIHHQNLDALVYHLLLQKKCA